MDRSTKPTFNFVHLSHPDDLKNEETQLRIRRLAMTEVGKARRKPKTRRERNEIVLEFRTPTETKQEIERFGGGQTDPFGPYPIPLDDTSRNLIANIFRSNSAHARQLRGSWYPVGLTYAPAFLNMLANSQLFLLKEHNGYFPSTDDALSLGYHHRALRIAAEYMKDPGKHTSDEVVASVTSFMCHHYILGSFAGWEKHRDALLKSIELRGGFDTVTSEHLRVTISWADLTGAFSQDVPPSVPLPQQWTLNSKSPPSFPRPFTPLALTWKKQIPMRLDWITIFEDIVQLISLDRAFTEAELVAAVTSGCWLEPTMYRLLAIRPLNLGSDPEYVIEEVCRLGTLIFLSPIWRSLGASPVWTSVLSRNLLSVLHEHMVEWQELKSLLIWTLYFAAVETRDLGERSQFVFMLAVLMSGMQMEEWGELLGMVKGVLWVESVFGGSDDLIREEVMQIVHQADIGGVLGEIRAELPMEMEEG